MRRTHGHALRRADPLDLGTRPVEQRGRHDSGRAFRRPGLRDRLLAPGAADPDYLLSVDDIARFEAAHGRIAKGAWALMRTDWSKRSPIPRPIRTSTRRASIRPGPSAEAVRFLVEQREVLGFGSEAIGTDAGQGYHLRPPYPCHYFMHGAGRYGLQCLANLDQLPPAAQC